MHRNQPSHFPARIALAILGLVVLGGFGSTSAQERGIGVRELEAALEISQRKNQELGAELEQSRAQITALTARLAEAVRISEEQFAQTRETSLKLQAFGVDLFSQDEDSLEQRLLRAVRELDIAEQETERSREQLQELSEYFLEFLNQNEGIDPQRKEEAVVVIDLVNNPLGPGEGSEPVKEVSDARIVSLDPEIGLVVFNAGKPSGLLIGTPISIIREEEEIYTALVVDVRDSISGALLQRRLAPDALVEVGDGVRLLPNESNL